MENSFSVSSDIPTLSNDTNYPIEDTALKLSMQYFADELLPYFHIDGEVDHIGPTEITHLELKKFYEDFNLVMKDGSWIHFEFQSSNNKATENLKRFRAYEAITSYQHNVDVRTYVLYSGNIKKPRTKLITGFNTYRVKPIIMKGHRVEEVFDSINRKLANSVPLTKSDLIPLTLCPLMGGELSQKERIQSALQLVKQTEHTIPDAPKIEAVIYAMATKFLDQTDLNEVKEGIKMTELGLLIYNDGIADEAAENAKNFLLNGVPYELVRKSIHHISDESLQKIYDEVMELQKK